MSSGSKFFLIPYLIIIIFFCLAISPHSAKLLSAEVTGKMQLEDLEPFTASSLQVNPILTQEDLAESKPFISKDYLNIPKPFLSNEHNKHLVTPMKKQEKIPFESSKRLLYHAEEVLVKFREGVTETEAISQIRSVHKLLVKKRFHVLSHVKGKEYLLVRQKGGKASEIAVMLKKDKLVEEVFLNNSGRFSSVCEGNIPNDDSFNLQWALCNTGQCLSGGCNSGTPDADIDATEAWEYQTGSKDIIIAILDTGVDYNHPDLKNNMWVNEAEANGIKGIDDDGNGYIDDIYGYDFGGDDSDPIDTTGHGTQVAGIIAAKGNNSEGISGVNWNVKIMSIKVATAEGDFYLANILEALEYLISMTEFDIPIVAVNASWGFEGKYIEILKDAIEELGKKGILFVAAAGNESSNNDYVPHSPASFDLPNIISVAATDRNDNKVNSSNYGPVSVDLGAPGDSIFTTFSFLEYKPGTGNDIFFDDMESGSGNWIAEGDWEITYEKSYSPNHAWSDSPSSNYQNDIGYSLTSKEIDLSGATDPLSLGFFIQFEMEDSKDWLEVSSWIRKRSLWEKTTEKAHQSIYAWSDSPYTKYPNELYSWLVSPMIDLSTADEGAELSFWLTGVTEKWLDNLLVYFSADGGENWDFQFLESGDYSDKWYLFSVSIPNNYRTSQFQVVFILWSNSDKNFDGFYLDDIEIKDSSSVFFYDGMESDEHNWTRPFQTDWKLLDSFTGSSGSKWQLINIPLNEDCFWDQFQIRFEIHTNSSTNYDGVYLDNIGIGTPISMPSYRALSGTSAATPHVTGAIALLKAEYPNEGPYTIQKRLLTGVDQLLSLDGKVATGGRLNLYTSITQDPLTLQEQIDGLLTFFDDSVTNGKLEGADEKQSQANKKLNILRDMIERASILIGKGGNEASCRQLMIAYEFCDGESAPDDMVKGDSAPYLAFMIMDLMINMGCKSKGIPVKTKSVFKTADSFLIHSNLSWSEPEINLSVLGSGFNSNYGWPSGFMIYPWTYGSFGLNPITSNTNSQAPLQMPIIVSPWTRTGNSVPLWYQSETTWFKNDFGAPWWWWKASKGGIGLTWYLSH